MPYYVIKTNPFTLESKVCLEAPTESDACGYAITHQIVSLMSFGVDLSHIDTKSNDPFVLNLLHQCLDFETLVNLQHNGGRFRYPTLFHYSISGPLLSSR